MWLFEVPFEVTAVFPTSEQPGPLTRDQAYAIYEEDANADYEQYIKDLREEGQPYDDSEYRRYLLRCELGYWPYPSTLGVSQ